MQIADHIPQTPTKQETPAIGPAVVTERDNKSKSKNALIFSEIFLFNSK